MYWEIAGIGGGDKGISEALEDLGLIGCKGQKKVAGKNEVRRFWADKKTVAGMSARELFDFYESSTPK